MQVPLHNLSGEVIGNIELSEAVFGEPFREGVVHQALLRQLANQRQGTADTKTRGEVEGSGRKIYAQKHTGRARQGMVRAPHRRGGGRAFGPHPRSYRQDLPKKMRRLALRCLLSAKVAEGALTVVDDLKLKEPKTKEMKGILAALKVEPPALIVTSSAEPNVVKSARNLRGVKTSPADVLNVVDLLSHRAMVATVGAVRRVEELWGQQDAGRKRVAEGSDASL